MERKPLPAEYYDDAYYPRMRGNDAGAEIADQVRAQGVMRIGKPAATGNILEVGCGQGQVVKRLRDAGYEAQGIDFAEAAVRTSVCPFVEQMDAGDISYPPATFGTVCTFHALEHLSEEGLPRCLAAMNALARNHIFIVVPGLTPVATREPHPEHRIEPPFDGWYKIFADGLPHFRMDHAEVWEPTYWVTAYECWFWFVRK